MPIAGPGAEYLEPNRHFRNGLPTGNSEPDLQHDRSDKVHRGILGHSRDLLLGRPLLQLQHGESRILRSDSLPSAVVQQSHHELLGHRIDGRSGVKQHPDRFLKDTHCGNPLVPSHVADRIRAGKSAKDLMAFCGLRPSVLPTAEAISVVA